MQKGTLFYLLLLSLTLYKPVYIMFPTFLMFKKMCSNIFPAKVSTKYTRTTLSTSTAISGEPGKATPFLFSSSLC